MKNTLIDFVPPGTPQRTEFNPPPEADDHLAEVATFYQNPFYDKLFGLVLAIRIRTYQSKKKVHLENYKDVVRQMVEELHLDGRFPLSGGLLLNLHFYGPDAELARLDVDNMAKLLIDLMKGHVMVDDNLVRMLWVEKSVDPVTRCTVGIKSLASGPIPIIMPPFHCERADLPAMLAQQGLSMKDVRLE